MHSVHALYAGGECQEEAWTNAPTELTRKWVPEITVSSIEGIFPTAVWDQTRSI